MLRQTPNNVHQLDDCLKILAASKQMFYLDYHSFAKRYGTNSTLSFIESLLRARGDLDKSDVKDIVGFCLSYSHPGEE